MFVVGQLSVPPQVAQTVAPQRHEHRHTQNQRLTQLLLRRLLRLLESDCCGSLNVDMVVVLAVVDVFVGQLSVPPQVAQTVGPQKQQQRPTKTAAHSMLTW